MLEVSNNHIPLVIQESVLPASGSHEIRDPSVPLNHSRYRRFAAGITFASAGAIAFGFSLVSKCPTAACLSFFSVAAALASVRAALQRLQ